MKSKPVEGKRRTGRRWRRWVVAAVAVLLVVPVLGIGTAAAVLWQRAAIDTVGQVDFVRPLAIPPLAESRIEDGHRVFDLRATAGATDFGVPGEPTETWGFNGSYLGPTLRAQRGEQVRVNVTNELPETTTVHWHGHHLPPEMDGGPHQPVPPGDSWSPEWTIDQPAATTWYHRIRTASPPSMSTEGWQGCSSLTIRTRTLPCHPSTVWTMCR